MMASDNEIKIVLAGIFQGISKAKVAIAAATWIGCFTATIAINIIDENLLVELIASVNLSMGDVQLASSQCGCIQGTAFGRPGIIRRAWEGPEPERDGRDVVALLLQQQRCYGAIYTAT